MADKKEPVERKFVKVGENKAEPKKPAPKREVPEVEEAPEAEAQPEAEEKPTPAKKPAKKAEEKPEKKPNYVEVDYDEPGKTRPERAKGYRIGAWVLWIVGIAFEVLAILILNKTMYVKPEQFNLFFFGALAVDLVAVIIASQLWKKANHIDPASEKNKAKFMLQNNLGVIMSIIAFLPIIILLLKNKDMDAKTKKIATIVAAAVLIIAGVSSWDFNPVSQEQLTEAKQDVSELSDTGDVYWTQFGKSYHCDPECHTLMRSKTVFQGSIEDAFEAKRSDPCDFCVKEPLEAGGGLVDTIADAVTDAVDGAAEQPAA